MFTGQVADKCGITWNLCNSCLLNLYFVNEKVHIFLRYVGS